MTRTICFLLCTVYFLLMGCHQNPEVSIELERAKILEIHMTQRDYHFEKDSISFANQLSDNFISVNRGVISRPAKEETISRYHGYFSAVEFLNWDDVSDPVIRFSDDGSMAYTIVEKLVKVAYPDEQGNVVEGETHFAWTAIYRRYGQEWKIDCVTSTERPPKQQ